VVEVMQKQGYFFYDIEENNRGGRSRLTIPNGLVD
jgi:hypothetical protein